MSIRKKNLNKKKTKRKLTGCLKPQLGLRQFPLNQYQQSFGLSLALSLWRYSHRLPWDENMEINFISYLTMLMVSKRKQRTLSSIKNMKTLVMEFVSWVVSSLKQTNILKWRVKKKKKKRTETIINWKSQIILIAG